MAGPQDDITYLLTIDPADTDLDVDVTEFVQSFSLSKGRDRETDQYKPATATLTLLDPDRRFDPNNEAGPYYPDGGYSGLVPMRKMTVRLDSANVENYVVIDSTQAVSSPDSAALSITGNIDIRWFGTLTDWTNGDQGLITKWTGSGSQQSWIVRAENSGIVFYMSSTGANVLSSTAVAVPAQFADGVYCGIRVTRVQASGLTTVYFSSDDGASWTSAGSSVVSAGSAIFDSTAKVIIGGQDGGFGSPPDAKVLRAEIWNGIEGSGGTIAASPTFNTLPAGYNLVFEPYTDAEGNVWTGESGDLDVTVAAGSRLFVGYVTDWSGDYLDGDRLSTVTVTATDGLGVLANCELGLIASAHSGDRTGERIQLVLERTEVEYPDPVSIDAGISVLGATTLDANALEYVQQCVKAEGGYLFVDRNGTLQFMDRHSLLNDSSSDLTFYDTHVEGGFYPSLPIPYKRLTQSSSADLLYNRITGTGTSGTPLVSSDQTSGAAFKWRTLPIGNLLLLNDAEVSALLQWHLYRFKDPEARFSSIEINTMSLSDALAQAVALVDLATLVTVERVPLGNVPRFRYFDVPGTASNYVSAPDEAGLDIVGNICLIARVAADDWTPSANQTIISKWLNTGNQRAYRLDLNTTGTLSFFWSTTGADNPSNTSSVALASTAGVADGEWLWLAVAMDIDEGGSRVVRFFYSTDPGNDPAEITWSALGTTGGGAATSIFASTATVNIGGHTLGATQPFAGKVAYASIRQGVGTSTVPGGTEKLTFDGSVDLDNVVSTATSFTASTGQTMTLNGSVTFGAQDPDAITRTCIVDGVEHTITAGSWVTVLRLGNADTRTFLVLNHPTYGQLNRNRLAF